ncbi:MAG: DUF5689 domain-containing protein [Rikenellaceae bacterium]|nr:DUF5689 domain-containing protein [Rikenellaceae bacterium]
MWYNNSWLLWIGSLLFTGCHVPFDPTLLDTGTDREISIQYLKSLYTNAPLLITEDFVIQGQVISSDEQGNFRWTLVIEDQAGGIELKVDLNPYYDRFPLGRQVRIRCAGLTLRSYGRTIQLGAISESEGYETGFISADRIGEYIRLTEKMEELTPKLLLPEDISMRYVNCAVSFDGVRFIADEQGLSWGEAEGYTERHLVFADYPEDTLTVRTSSTALFGPEILPSGVGSLEGVLTQFAGTYSLVLNELDSWTDRIGFSAQSGRRCSDRVPPTSLLQWQLTESSAAFDYHCQRSIRSNCW